MSGPIVIIDSSRIDKAKLDEVRQAFIGLSQFAKNNEPRVLAYHVYFNNQEGIVTVFQIHPDSASAEFHMNIAGPIFKQFKNLLRLIKIDVYGEPGEGLLLSLQNKAHLLGSESLIVHSHMAGFFQWDTSV